MYGLATIVGSEPRTDLPCFWSKHRPEHSGQPALVIPRKVSQAVIAADIRFRLSIWGGTQSAVIKTVSSV